MTSWQTILAQSHISNRMSSWQTILDQKWLAVYIYSETFVVRCSCHQNESFAFQKLTVIVAAIIAMDCFPKFSFKYMKIVLKNSTYLQNSMC